MLKGELVIEESMEEPISLKWNEGLVTVNVGARPSVLKGELVIENSREEPVSLKWNEGLVTANV